MTPERALALSCISNGVLVIETPRFKSVIRVRREGVESDLGCLVLFPIWVFTVVRWALSSRRWEVTVSAPSSDRKGRLIQVERTLYDTREELREAVEKIVGQLETGDFDARFELRTR